MAELHSHLLRGGSWYFLPRGCRSACRCHDLPDGADDGVGFRVVCPLPADHTIPLENRHG